MSWLSKLGNILSIAGPIAAIPFTGGASALGLGAGAAGSAAGIGSKILSGIGKAAPVLGAIGTVASNAAKGSADQRVTEGNQALNYAQLEQQAARDKATFDRSAANDKFGSDLALSNAQFGSGMQGAQFNREGQDRARHSQVLSQLLNNTQDFKATPGNPAIAKAMGSSTGGARPSNLTTNRGALMAQLAQPQIDAPTYAGPAAYQAPTPYNAPAVPIAPKAGIGEKILGGIGLGGSFLGTLPKYGTPGQQIGTAAPPTPPQLSDVDLAYLRAQNPELVL